MNLRAMETSNGLTKRSWKTLFLYWRYRVQNDLRMYHFLRLGNNMLEVYHLIQIALLRHMATELYLQIYICPVLQFKLP